MLTFKEFLKESLTKEFKDIDFEYHDDLNPKFWKGDKLKKKIRKQLLLIADTFLETVEDSKVKIEDITFTGSLANYNWGSKSDVDLHIVFDDKDSGDVDAKDYLKAKAKLWKTEHPDITIRGFPVEVSPQGTSETHESTGIYSLKGKQWVRKPKAMTDPQVDHDEVKRTLDELTKEINRLIREKASSKDVEKFRDDLKKRRKTGLKKRGELDVDNLAFKALRKAGFIDKLYQYELDAMSRELSL